MVVEDNLLNLNSGRKTSRSGGRDDDATTNLVKTDSATYLKNPAWTRTDHAPNLSEYQDRKKAIPNLKIRKMAKKVMEAQDKARTTSNTLLVVNFYKENFKLELNRKLIKKFDIV